MSFKIKKYFRRICNFVTIMHVLIYYRIVFQSNIWLRCRSWQVWILPSGKKRWERNLNSSIDFSFFFSPHWMENSIIHSTKFHGLQYCAFQIVDKDFIWISPPWMDHRHPGTNFINIREIPINFAYSPFHILFPVH